MPAAGRRRAARVSLPMPGTVRYRANLLGLGACLFLAWGLLALVDMVHPPTRRVAVVRRPNG